MAVLRHHEQVYAFRFAIYHVARDFGNIGIAFYVLHLLFGCSLIVRRDLGSGAIYSSASPLSMPFLELTFLVESNAVPFREQGNHKVKRGHRGHCPAQLKDLVHLCPPIKFKLTFAKKKKMKN